MTADLELVEGIPAEPEVNLKILRRHSTANQSANQENQTARYDSSYKCLNYFHCCFREILVILDKLRIFCKNSLVKTHSFSSKVDVLIIKVSSFSARFREKLILIF